MILIESGIIKTGFGNVASRELGGATAADGPYADFNRARYTVTASAKALALNAVLRCG